MTLLEMIQKENAADFTHGGKFHADDVFSAALLLHFNPKLTIQRGNRVPEEFDGIVFDIGRGEYDHHQKDSRNGCKSYDKCQSNQQHQEGIKKAVNDIIADHPHFS